MAPFPPRSPPSLWEDWLAAVRLGVRRVRERIGPDKPLVLVGYSNGGALALKYALDQVESGDGVRATRLVLISPMIGVAPFAWMSRVISLLGPIPYFEKARLARRHARIQPVQGQLVSGERRVAVVAVDDRPAGSDSPTGKRGRLKQLPPMLAFQSLVDPTVSTSAVVHALFDQLDGNGSQLVMFDINRLSGLAPFIDPEGRDAAVAAHGRVTASRANRGDERRPGIAGRGRAIDCGRASQIATQPLGPLLAIRDVLARAHRAAVRDGR